MDFTGLAEVQDAIRELGIEIEEEKDVFKALGGLLHLGQVRSTSRLPTLLIPPLVCACCVKPNFTFLASWTPRAQEFLIVLINN